MKGFTLVKNPKKIVTKKSIHSQYLKGHGQILADEKGSKF